MLRANFCAPRQAREHFNRRNGVLVPELEGLGSCPIKLETTYMDSAHDRRTATSALLSYSRNNSLCAVVGPANDFVTQGLSSLTEALKVPQISYASNGYRLSSKSEYPTVARVLPVAYDFGEAVAKFFNRDVLEREVAGIIYEDTDYGEQFESPLEEYEDALGYLTITEGFSAGDDDSIRSAMQEAKDKGFRTIVLITDQVALLDDVARIASDMDMLGAGYFYIISGGALPPTLLAEEVRYPVDSPADKMLRGAALFTNYDRFVYFGDDDPFMAEWSRQARSFARKVRRIEINSEIDELLGDAQDFFETETPTEYASYMYDAVITAGMSACSAWAAGQDTAGSETHGYMAHVLGTEFTGTSGPFRFKDTEDADGQPAKENFRDPKGTVFGIYNVRPGVVGEDGLRR